MKKKPGFKGYLKLLKTTFKEWYDEDPFRQSAVIAYYAVFSLPALLLLVVSVAQAFFGEEAVMGSLSYQVGSTMGTETASDVEEMIAAVRVQGNSVPATVIGIIVLIFGATGVFVQLQKSLNAIWEVEADPEKPFLKTIKDRFFSFGIILSVGFLLLVSLLVSSALTSASDWVSGHLPD